MPKMFGYQAKEIAYNIYCYYKKRKMNKESYEYKEDINIIDKISDITKMPKSSITRIIKEGNTMKVEDGVVDFKPKEKKKLTRKKRVIVDGFTEGVIRRKLIQLASVRKLNAVLKEENILQCSKEYLRQLLHRLGFTSTDAESSGLLKEHPDILSDRMCYLKAIKSFRAQNRSIFYLNETKLLALGNDEIAKSKDMPSSVMVHTGGVGFLDETHLMLKMKPTSEEDECFEHFENYDWVKDTVLTNIPPNSVIIINIPYYESSDLALHVEKPTTESTKAYKESWLNQHNISFKQNSTEAELMELINSHEVKMDYNITNIIKETGHVVLHLPQNHSDLNPVAVMWHDVKEEEEENNTPAYELFISYSTDQWEECLEHVKQNEEEYYAYGLKTIKPIYVLQSDKKDNEDMKSSTNDSENENSMDCKDSICTT